MIADLLGKQVGEYRLVRFLGNGTFGDVYEGVQIYLETHVAIKLLKGSFTEVEIKEFQEEARILARLEHPNIVRIFTFNVAMFDEQKLPFLAMSLAPNGTLLKRHPRGTPLPLTIIVTYVMQIASALQYAHHKKYIHRDVKPENILLGKNDELLLSDFGIAVVAHSTHSQETQKPIGSWAYAAPEQFVGKAVSASDQYSLGVVVYEWLCGERPFSGNFQQLAYQHQKIPPQPLHEKMNVSPMVEQVIMRALAKVPEQRFENVRAFAKALVECSGPGSHSKPQPPTPMPSPPSPPNPGAPPRWGRAPAPLPGQVQSLKDRLIDIQPLMVRVPKVPADLPRPMLKKYKQLLSREFEIGEYPVTNVEYQRFVAAGHRAPKYWKQRAFPGSAFPPEMATHPVVGITKQDAEAYCAWLSPQTRNRYRLPTPQEWEWAASGPQRQQYPWGKQFDQSSCNTEESGIGGPTPVDQYVTGKSFCGAKDMSGNVWEITQSSCRSFDNSKYQLIPYVVVIVGTLIGVALGIYSVSSINGHLPDIISYVIFDILLPGILSAIGAAFVSYCVGYAIGYFAFLIQLRPTLRGGAWNASSDNATCFSRKYGIDEKATGFRLMREV